MWGMRTPEGVHYGGCIAYSLQSRLVDDSSVIVWLDKYGHVRFAREGTEMIYPVHFSAGGAQQ
jgi:hypothetical protein